MKLSSSQILLWLRWTTLTAIGGTSGLLITMILPLGDLFFFASYTVSAVLAYTGQWILLDKLIHARKGWIATGLIGLIAPMLLLMSSTAFSAGRFAQSIATGSADLSRRRDRRIARGAAPG